MALLISYRGNLTGLSDGHENSVPHVQKALDAGFRVMVDVWAVAGGNLLALGNEFAQYAVSHEFLQNRHVLCRARDLATMEKLLEIGTHCFYGEGDGLLTNGGLIWTLPGKKITPRCIATFPEHVQSDPTALRNLMCAGVCSNFIQDIRDAIRADGELVETKEDASVASETGSMSMNSGEEKSD